MLHILLKESEEMMQKVTLKVEGLERKNTSVLQREENDIHKPISPKSDDVFTEKCVEESPNLPREYDSFPSFSCLLKYDLYDDDYVSEIQYIPAEELDLILGESSIQVSQPGIGDRLAHFSYEEKEENIENSEFSEGALPFCFEPFQFIKDNYHAICNQVSSTVDIDHLEESQILAPIALPLDLQPQSAIECQIEEIDLEPAVYDQMTQVDSLPLCFQSSELFEEEEEKPVQIYQVSFEPVCNNLQVSFQVSYNPSADRPYDGINQCYSPLVGCRPQYQVVGDFQIPRHDSDPKPLYSSLIQLSNNVYMLQDPFLQFLDSAKKVSSFHIFSMVNRGTSDYKISVSSTSKHKQ